MARFFCMFKFSRSTLAFLAVGGALVAIVGCQPRGTDLAAIYRQAPPAFASVDYATLRSNVLAPQCISCHADFGTESGLQNYIVPGDSTSSALYRAVANGSMPPGGPPLAGTAVDMFKTYIDGLKTPAPDNHAPISTPVPVSTPPAAADYAAVRARILAPRCLQCHGDFGAEAGLKSYVTPGDPGSSSLYQSVANGSMPPGGPAISADDLALLKTYIAGMRPVSAEEVEGSSQ